MDSIVFIMAHPDDVGAAQGGTALLLKEHFKLHVICATKGERGIAGVSYDEAAKIRELEEKNACDLINAELTFLGKINGQLYADKEICDEVTRMVDEIAPKAVITFWPVDYHEDHRAAAEIARKAVQFSKHSIELCFGEAGYLIQTTHFEPEIYVDITQVMPQKLDLIRCHESQNKDELLIDLFTGYGKMRGDEIGVAYAEGFRSVMDFGKKEDSILFQLSEAIAKHG